MPLDKETHGRGVLVGTAYLECPPNEAVTGFVGAGQTGTALGTAARTSGVDGPPLVPAATSLPFASPWPAMQSKLMIHACEGG